MGVRLYRLINIFSLQRYISSRSLRQAIFNTWKIYQITAAGILAVTEVEGTRGWTFENVVERILKFRNDLTREEVEKLIDKKIKELEGLIDYDAAALLIAKELGVPLPNFYTVLLSGRLEIEDLIPGLKNVKLLARIVRIAKPIVLGSSKKILRVLLADKSGVTELIAWDKQADELDNKLKPGDCVLISGAYVRKYKGKIELGLLPEARVEILDSPDVCELPSLTELIEKYDVNTFCINVQSVIREESGCVVYGLKAGAPVQLLIPKELGFPDPHPGEILIVQDARALESEVPRYRATKLTRIYRGGQTSVEEVFKVLSVDEVQLEDMRFLVGIRGMLAASLPLRGRGVKIILVGERASTSILSFHDRIAVKLNLIKPTTIVEIRGLYYSKQGLRLNPYAGMEILGKLDEKVRDQQPYKTLAVKNGYIECRATITLSRAKCRITESGDLLLSFMLNVDDGLGLAYVPISNNEQICELLKTDWDEIRELATTGVLPAILSYMEEWMRGLDVEVKGWLSGDRTLAAEQIKLVT